MLNLTLYKEPWSGDPGQDRNQFLGGSDTGTILGINPYKSAYTLWLEKTGKREPDDLSNALAVKIGHMCEETVAKLYEEETGYRVRESLVSYRCKEYPFLRGHVDRLVVNDKNRGLECKTTSSHNHFDYEKGEVPPYYYSQCQFYMMLTGRSVWDLATLKDNTEFYVITIDRDDEYIETMLQHLINFWWYVENDVPPEIDGSESTRKSITQMYPGGASNTVSLNELDEQFRIRAEAAEMESYWKSIKNAADNKIRNAMGNSETGLSTEYVVTWKPQAGRLNQEKARALLGEENWNACLNEPSRVLKVRKKKEARTEPD